MRNSSGYSQLKEEYKRAQNSIDFLTREKTRLKGVADGVQQDLNELQQKVIRLHEELLHEKNKTIEKFVGSVQTTVK